MQFLGVSLPALGDCDRVIIFPCLFIVIMEALSQMLEKALVGGYILGFSIGNSYGML
jgi:hypothetical protein